MIECYHTACKNHSVHYNPSEGPFCNQEVCNMELLPDSQTNADGSIVLMRNPIVIKEVPREPTPHELASRPEKNRNVRHVTDHD